MIKDKFGQYIYNENDICNIIMEGIDVESNEFMVDDINDTDILNVNEYVKHHALMQNLNSNDSIEEYDRKNQENWYMPDEYKKMDIAEYILSLCETDSELQRCGQELIMYQERNLFNLLKYLKYLVDIMKENNIIWGVGRGSSVSSFVLFRMEVHKINSMYYKLNVDEFLR